MQADLSRDDITYRRIALIYDIPDAKGMSCPDVPLVREPVHSFAIGRYLHVSVLDKHHEWSHVNYVDVEGSKIYF